MDLFMGMVNYNKTIKLYFVIGIRDYNKDNAK